MINKFIGIGHLTRSPELKDLGEYTKCVFSIAINSSKKKSCLWMSNAGTRLQATAINIYQKGSRLHRGKIKVNKWEDKDGNKRQKVFCWSRHRKIPS